MPSSLETRMRVRRRSSGKSNATGDNLDSSHIGPERSRHRDRAVGALIILHHRDQRAADGEAGPIERMDEAGPLPAFGFAARIHAPRLIVAAVRARRNLAVGARAGALA